MADTRRFSTNLDSASSETLEQRQETEDSLNQDRETPDDKNWQWAASRKARDIGRGAGFIRDLLLNRHITRVTNDVSTQTISYATATKYHRRREHSDYSRPASEEADSDYFGFFNSLLERLHGSSGAAASDRASAWEARLVEKPESIIMDSRIPEFTVEALADKWTVKDVVKGIVSMVPLGRMWLSLQVTCSRPLLRTGILHTIFFHRFFPTVIPQAQEILDVFVPKIDDAELETLIEARSEAVARELDADSVSVCGPGNGLRTQVVVTFNDKKRLGRKKTAPDTSGDASPGAGKSSPAASPNEGTTSKPWYQGVAAAGFGLVGGPRTSQQSESREEEICWERWVVRVSIAEPKTDSGMF